MLKLAPELKFENENSVDGYPRQARSPESYSIVWDLARDFYQEETPRLIERAVHLSHWAKTKRYPFLPQFVSYSRCNLGVKLTMSGLPVALRSLIGDRAQMEIHGHRVI